MIWLNWNPWLYYKIEFEALPNHDSTHFDSYQQKLNIWLEFFSFIHPLCFNSNLGEGGSCPGGEDTGELFHYGFNLAKVHKSRVDENSFFNLSLPLSFWQTSGGLVSLLNFKLHTIFVNCNSVMYRVSQKKGGFVENGHWGLLDWTRIKSRTIFEKFRKFPIFWAQEL